MPDRGSGTEGAPEEAERPVSELPIIVKQEDRDWWPVWLMGSAAALLLAIAMIFTVITSVQARNKAVERNNEQIETIECRAAFNAAITAAEQEADNAEHDLFAEIVRQVVLPEPDPDSGARLTSMADTVTEHNSHTTQLIHGLEEYIAAGSPLPCPLEIGE